MQLWIYFRIMDRYPYSCKALYKLYEMHKNGGTTMKGKKLVALLAAGAMVFSPAGMALGTPLGGGYLLRR